MWQCDQCDFECSTTSNLSWHKKNQIKCEHCDFKSCRTGNLRRHTNKSQASVTLNCTRGTIVNTNTRKCDHVTLNVLRLVIWVDIKQINSNVTTATLNPLRQVIWGDTRRKVKLNVTSMALKSTQDVIWRNTWVKVQVNVTNVTLNDLQQVKWFDIRKVKLNVTNVTNIFYTPYEGRDVVLVNVTMWLWMFCDW